MKNTNMQALMGLDEIKKLLLEEIQHRHLDGAKHRDEILALIVVEGVSCGLQKGASALDDDNTQDVEHEKQHDHAPKEVHEGTEDGVQHDTQLREEAQHSNDP